MAERLEKVKAFGELRVGVLLVVKWCGFCGDPHRGQVIKYMGRSLMRSPGSPAEEWDAVEVIPRPSCQSEGRWAVTPECVSLGRVFKVDTGLEAPAATTRAKRPAPASR